MNRVFPTKGHCARISLPLSPYFQHLCPFFYSIFYYFWSRSPRIPQQKSFFEGAHDFFLGINQCPSLLCWCIVIHHHWPQGTTIFRTVRLNFTCGHSYGTSWFKSQLSRINITFWNDMHEFTKLKSKWYKINRELWRKTSMT